MDGEALYKELHFLIAKFLQISPCQNTLKTFIEELNEHHVLPKRLDWNAALHSRSYDEMETMFSHINSDHLLEICRRIGNTMQRENNSISHVPSLLGMGNHSLIKKDDIERKYYSVTQCAVRKHQAPLLEPVTFRKHNFLRVLYGREISGPFNRKHFLSGCQYKNIVLLGRTLGHLSAVYCILFDSSGQYIVTGADDLLVKVWHAVSGKLLCTLRGASAEITDLAMNNENTLLAAGSVDKVVRIWCLQTAYPVATLTIHTGLITSVNFCPSVVNGCRYFASTATDGSVAFWKYATDENGTTSFETTPVQYLERMRPGCAQILCGAFSAGGMFLATGSADHNVRVYKMAGLEGPTRVLEIEVHSDRVDSILWAHSHLKFVSGSKDGTGIIWYYHEQRWKYKILCMSTKFPGMKTTNEDNKQKIRVTMLSWDKSDQWVITASSDNVIRVWDSCSGHLIQVLQGHRAETYVIESHPLDSKILMSAGHDGKIFLWNIITGEILTSFQNSIDGHGFGAVFDAKWSPDGSMFSATDSHGQILTFGLGLPDITRKVPRELFFHTDYRPLTRDNNSMVLDEQTQTPPHLMPPPFLVDIDGNPYPPYLQRLVPGREQCDVDQLVPNVVLNDEGRQEVIAGASSSESNSMSHNLVDPRNRSRLRARYGVRFAGDIEGVRQSSGNWQRGDNILWTDRLICKPLDKYVAIAMAERIRSLAYLELEDYRRESKRIPEPPPVNVPKSPQKSRKARVHHAYRTRASRTEQLQMDFENAENLVSSESRDDDSTTRESELDSSSSSDDSASSDYSDWTADNGINKLEPPKRTARVRNIKKAKKMASTTQKKSAVAQDVPEEYRVPDWLSEVYPKKSPYYPQMGDEVMFFQQGYNLYLNAVQNKNIYKVRPAQLNPWRKIKLKEPQLVKIIGIKYEIRPPRLCGLRLAVMDNEQVTEYSFDLKYHDISDVIDFLVVRQVYDTAISRNWKVGDRFRSVIDDAWWFGTIVSRNRNAQSPFLCYRIRWDSNENESLSPWDLEPVGARKPQVGSSLPILPREMKSILYKADSEEWPGGGIEVTCKRILRGLEDLMSMSIAEHFLVPVDVSLFPTYAQTIEYPMDLSTIKARLENRFYRRLTAVQFDARYLASNAEKFNEHGSEIVKKARIVTETLLKIIKALIPLDVTALVHQLQENYFSADSADEKEDLSNKPGPFTRFQLRSGSYRSSRPMRRCNMKEINGKFDWLRECKTLLQLLWISEDGAPFRHPVDRMQHPDYDKIVDTPIDLSMIREELQVGNYRGPVELCKDVRLMFENAKNYTPNKRSRIYAMTVRLSGLAETHIRRILYHWKRSTKDQDSDSEIASTSRRSSKRKRQLKDSTEDGESYSDDNQVHRSRLRTTTTSTTTTTTTTTTLGDEYPRETRSSGRLRRKIKKIVLSENKKSDNNSTDSEWEKRYTPTKGISTRGHKRILRERKLWNYAKMLESTTDFSDNDEPLTRRTVVNSSASAGGSTSAGIAARVVRSSRNNANKRSSVASLSDDGRPCTSRSLRRNDYDYDASSNDAVNNMSATTSAAGNSSTTGGGGGSSATSSSNNLTINTSASIDSNKRESSRNIIRHPPITLRSRVRRTTTTAATDDAMGSSENDLRHHSRLLRRRQICHYVENTDSSDDDVDYDDYDDDDNKDEDVDISVSVSSRGRIRRLTAKARAHVFRDI